MMANPAGSAAAAPASGLTLQQKKALLWGSKKAEASLAKAAAAAGPEAEPAVAPGVPGVEQAVYGEWPDDVYVVQALMPNIRPSRRIFSSVAGKARSLCASAVDAPPHSSALPLACSAWPLTCCMRAKANRAQHRAASLLFGISGVHCDLTVNHLNHF